jgi:hypothetical protein
MAAVRWRTPPRDIAALVTQTGTRGFAAELFHFGAKPRPMTADLYLLKPGRYRVELREGGHDGPLVGTARELRANGSRTKVPFTLPPRELCALRVTPAENHQANGPGGVTP